MDLKTEKRSLRHKIFEAQAYSKFFIKWILAAFITGVIAGMVGIFFHKLLEIVTE